MTCSYCGSRNGEAEHRCHRCGRRPGDTLNQEMTMHRTDGALATKLRPSEAPLAATVGQALERPSNSWDLAGAVQGNLFPSKVVPISVAAPPAPGARSGHRAKAPASSTAAKTPLRRPRRVAEGQGELDFLAPAPLKPRELATTVDARIFCDARAAAPLHRAVAAALDWSMVLIGYGLFLATYYCCGGRFYFDRTNLLTFGAALVLLGCAYGLFWTIAGTETAGMRWTHLRLITFNGLPPDRRHRLMRFAGSCLSFFTIVGALWALADEESLGWQDHISRTFPAAHDLESRVFRRG